MAHEATAMLTSFIRVAEPARGYAVTPHAAILITSAQKRCVPSTHGERAGRTGGSLRGKSGTPLVIRNGSNPKIGATRSHKRSGWR